MRATSRLVLFCAFTVAFGAFGWSQSNPAPDPASTKISPQSEKTVQENAKKTGPEKEMGKGGEDIGKGVGKGTGDLAKGTAGAVGSLAHGNFGGAGASMGKGAGGLGKNVAVGTGKGVGKLGKGIGGELKKLGGKSKRHEEKTQG